LSKFFRKTLYNQGQLVKSIKQNTGGALARPRRATPPNPTGVVWGWVEKSEAFFCPTYFFSSHSVYFDTSASGQININSLSKNQIKLDPNWVTGFCEAEGSFTVTISKSSKMASGWQVFPCFKISLHKKDRVLLEMIQTYFTFFSYFSLRKKSAKRWDRGYNLTW
jgi:hypothetical protein